MCRDDLITTCVRLEKSVCCGGYRVCLGQPSCCSGYRNLLRITNVKENCGNYKGRLRFFGLAVMSKGVGLGPSESCDCSRGRLRTIKV